MSLPFLESWAHGPRSLEGEMKVLLVGTGYFFVIFSCMSNRNKVFEGDPYFYDQVGLFIKGMLDSSPHKSLYVVGSCLGPSSIVPIGILNRGYLQFICNVAQKVNGPFLSDYGIEGNHLCSCLC